MTGGVKSSMSLPYIFIWSLAQHIPMVAALILLLSPPRLPQFDPIELVARYRAYGLPEPPLSDRPVLCTDESTVQFVGFRAAGKRTKILFGPWHPYPIDSEFTPKVEELAKAHIHRIDADDTLWPTVAVLESRGEGNLAERVLRNVFLQSQWDNSEYLNPWRLLRQSAWGFWRRRAIEHPNERQGLDAWLFAMPKIDGLGFSRDEKSFLLDLAASLRRPMPPKGRSRFDDLMEQTVDAKGEALSDQKYGPWRDAEVDELAVPVVKLWEAGFDAVPTLFRYLDDRRITLLGVPRHPTILDVDRAFYHRVCDVAADLIETAVVGGPDYYATERRESGVNVRQSSPDDHIRAIKALWPKWLAEKKMGEARVLLARMKEFDEEERGALDTVSTDGARAYPLRVLAYKYPHALMRFYRHVKFSQESSQIYDALRGSSLTAGEKRQISGKRHPFSSHGLAGFEDLHTGFRARRKEFAVKRGYREVLSKAKFQIRCIVCSERVGPRQGERLFH
jgi:hypothetical protein